MHPLCIAKLIEARADMAHLFLEFNVGALIEQLEHFDGSTVLSGFQKLDSTQSYSLKVTRRF
jgi:hypothetical protein